ncbi:hypothetical protein MMC13_007308 [Lambiella insularis]|nr:hypothetical protein [Lambiella insularis]
MFAPAPLPLSIHQHKTAIALQWMGILTTGFLIPIVAYFALTYASTLALKYVLAIITGIFGVSSLYSLGLRSFRLFRKFSSCRPLGSTNRWALDYFNWNFCLGFAVVTVAISYGTSRTPSDLRLASMPLTILMLQVCAQLVALPILQALRVRTPFRISSLARGAPLRPGVFVIAEDVVAVDANQGTAFRQAWNDRYDSSPPFRQLMSRMDWMWGITGLMVAAGIIAVIYTVQNRSIGYAIGR